jgi:hypothetical protein
MARTDTCTTPYGASREHEAAIAMTCFTTIKVEKKKKRGISKKNKITLPSWKIVQYMTLPQPLASELMGVSISTLKRRYYALNYGRWPINSSNGEVVLEEYTKSKKMKAEDKLNIRNLVHKENNDPTTIDPLTAKVLQCAFNQNDS